MMKNKAMTTLENMPTKRQKRSMDEAMVDAARPCRTQHDIQEGRAQTMYLQNSYGERETAGLLAGPHGKYEYCKMLKPTTLSI